MAVGKTVGSKAGVNLLVGFGDGEGKTVKEGEGVGEREMVGEGKTDGETVGEISAGSEGVTEGKTDEFASGFRYIRGQAGPVQRYPLSDGSFVYMTPERAKEFLAHVKKPATGVVPKGFKVTERADVPWYERTEVNRTKLDEAARNFQNATPEGEVLRGSQGAE